jgi:predicted dehydrogenase
MKENPLRVGIAGYGVVGKRRRNFIDQHPRLQTVAVCDRQFDDEGQFSDGVRYYQTYERLLTEELDILFVCLTNDVAAAVTIAGLENNLHVFCEKPPGRDLNDIAAVIAVENKHPNLKLMYGFNHRYHESVQEALRIVRSGELGELINIKGTYGKSKIISFDSDWRTKRDIAGGGILLDQGIHMVDMMRLFAGEFVDIHSFVTNSFWNHDVEDNAYALMRSESGVVAMLHSSATQWRHRFNLELTLSKGALILSGILSGSKSYGAETITIVHASKSDSGDPKEFMIRYNEDPSWRDEIAVFADAVLIGDKGRIENGTSYEAFKTMELVYKIYTADPFWKSKYNIKDTIAEESKL